MSNFPDADREISTSQANRIANAPDLSDRLTNSAITHTDGQNTALPEIYFTNINDSGDKFICNREGQITEFQYFGQTQPYKILRQENGSVTEFQCPSGTICTLFEGSWGTYNPHSGKTRGSLSQTEVTLDEDGLHVDSRMGRDFLELPLNAVPHQINAHGDIFTLDESGTRVNEFQYKGESGFYKVDSRRLNGDIYQINTPNGDVFHNEGSAYSPEWYRRFYKTTDPYEKVIVTGPFYKVAVELTDQGLTPEARIFLNQD